MTKGPERRHAQRRKFTYYMPVMDDDTQELVGHLSDISPRGFKLDSARVLPVGKEYRLSLELTSDIADHAFMVLVARTVWLREDPLMPNMNNIGFELIEILPEDAGIFQSIIDKYGAENNR